MLTFKMLREATGEPIPSILIFSYYSSAMISLDNAWSYTWGTSQIPIPENPSQNYAPEPEPPYVEDDLFILLMSASWVRVNPHGTNEIDTVPWNDPYYADPSVNNIIRMRWIIPDATLALADPLYTWTDIGHGPLVENTGQMGMAMLFRVPAGTFDPTPPFITTKMEDSTFGTTFTVPSITTTAPNSVIYYWIFGYNNNLIAPEITPPSSCTGGHPSTPSKIPIEVPYDSFFPPIVQYSAHQGDSGYMQLFYVNASSVDTYAFGTVTFDLPVQRCAIMAFVISPP